MSTNTEILSSTELDLRELAADVVARAMKGGATAADAVVRDGAEFSTVVRMGEVESLKEAGSRGIGLRVFHGKRVASTYSSDFSNEGLERLVHGALDLAKITSDDPCAGLPDPAELGSLPGDLKLYHEDVYSLPPEQRIEYARRAEKASFEADPRIKNSEGGAFDDPPGAKSWLTPWDLWVSTSSVIAPFCQHPSRRMRMALCNAISGIPPLAAWHGWNLRNR